MAGNGSPTIGVRLATDSPLRAFLADRAARAYVLGLATQVVTELGMWRSALALELARTEWTLGELGMLADVCKGAILDASLSTGRTTTLQAEVWDATNGIESDYVDLYGVQPADLIKRLGTLGPVETHALTDAISRWWADPADYEDAHSEAGWVRVGVRVATEPTD